jgi:hypothetical protein
VPEISGLLIPCVRDKCEKGEIEAEDSAERIIRLVRKHFSRPDFHAVHDRGASLSARGQWVCTFSLLVPVVPKVPMVPNVLNDLNGLNVLNPNAQLAYSSICSL